MKSPPLLAAWNSIPEGLIVRNTRRISSGSVRGSPWYEYVTYVEPSKPVCNSPCPYEAVIISTRNNKRNDVIVNILRGCLLNVQPNSFLLCTSTLTAAAGPRRV